MKEEYLHLGKEYLQSNACGMQDGAKKAGTHAELCALAVSEILDIPMHYAGLIYFEGERIVDLVREATRPLTDNLDTEIGFPLDIAPNYKRLTPLFAYKFVELVVEWFDEQTTILNDMELEKIVSEICRRKFVLAYGALESYGFEFVDGDPDKFLTMESKLGQVVTIMPNMYFGCSFTIDKTLTV